MLTEKVQYTNRFLRPVLDAEEAKTLQISLPALTTFEAGQVMGQIVGTGTAVNEVQSLATSGTPTGGTFRLQLGDQISAPIAHNASAAAVQAILEAMTTIGVGNVVCGGGALPTAVTITFQGAMAGLSIPLITLFSNALTGGTTPSAAVTRTTAGNPAVGHYAAYNDALSNGVQVARGVLQFRCVTDNEGKITFTGGEWGQNDRVTPMFYAGTFRTVDLIGLDANAVTDFGRLIAGTTLTDAATLIRIR